jgi:hypothetical protein
MIERFIIRIGSFWWQRRRNYGKNCKLTQGKVEILTLQTSNGGESATTENQTKPILYDELVK